MYTLGLAELEGISGAKRKSTQILLKNMHTHKPINPQISYINIDA